MDGMTFPPIEQGGVNGWLAELAKELQGKTYRPQAVRRVWIPKPGTDKQRPLGVPCITLRGWGNYFCLGAVSRAYRAVDNHARHRRRQWLNGKARSRGVKARRHAPLYLHRDLGLLRLAPTTAHRS